MSRAGIRFRPMGIGDLLDETISLYRRNFLLFAGVEAVLFVPVGVLQLLLIPQGASFRASTASQLGARFLVYWAAYVIADLAVLAALMHAVSAVCLGEAGGVGNAYARLSGRVWPLFRLTLVYGLAISAMWITILGIPFSVFFAVAWGMAYPVLILEGKGVRASMGRSRALMRGSWWRTFGITLLAYLLTSIVSSFFTVPNLIFAGIATGMRLSGVASIVVGVFEVVFATLGKVIVGPISTCCWVLVYYDLRVRKEGFDLELQAREIGAPEMP